jgi:hypothetical protein
MNEAEEPTLGQLHVPGEVLGSEILNSDTLQLD